MTVPAEASANDVPLVCDLDGTLVQSDTTYELLLLYLKQHPLLGLFTVFRWYLAGKATMKINLHSAVGDQLAVGHLPINRNLLNSETFQSAGSRILVSGAPQPVVEDVAKSVSAFDATAGTNANTNLTSQEKASYLTQTYPQGFDYIGNSHDDLAVWQESRRAFAVNAPDSVVQKAKSRGIDLEILQPRISQIRPLITGMRLHQWVKNSLVFVVPALNLGVITFQAIVSMLLVFLAFGLVASATYLLNDLLDIQEDRKHHKKRSRPFASGSLDIPHGVAAIGFFFLSGLAIASLVSLSVAFFLLVYASISLAYSLYLKRLVVLDVIVLSFLFCWRIFIGGVAFGADTNVWFMTAVSAFFLSLAFGKRAIELSRGREKADATDVLHGRGYETQDYPVVLGLGLVSGMVAPLIVLIYVFLSGSSIVDHGISAMFLSGLLCFWISRFWILVNRGAVHDDPIVFALKDKHSASLLVGMALILVLEQVN